MEVPRQHIPQPAKALQQLSQSELAQLSEQTGTLLLLDVPEGTIVGLDFTSYTVGPSFKGIKLIPPGLHLVHYCARDKTTGEVRHYLARFCTGRARVAAAADRPDRGRRPRR